MTVNINDNVYVCKLMSKGYYEVCYGTVIDQVGDSYQIDTHGGCTMWVEPKDIHASSTPVFLKITQLKSTVW